MTTKRDITGGRLLVAGVVALLISAVLILFGILLGSDEPHLAKPFWMAGYLLGCVGLGLVVSGLALLLYTVIRARR